MLSQTYGSQDEDLIVTAITDEKTGEVLKEPVFLASFTLENVGGPLRNERPDATGLYLAGPLRRLSRADRPVGPAGRLAAGAW